MHPLTVLLFASIPAFDFDPAVQRIAEEALEFALTNPNVAGGIILVGDPNDGRVLAMAATPAYSDPLQRTIVPASLVKPFVIAAALESGQTTPGATHDCENGELNVGGRVFRDWRAFGALSTADTLIWSSNICSLKIASKLGEQRTRAAFKAFGLQSSPSAAMADYAVGSLRFSPLEVLQAYGSIANGGELLAARNAMDPSQKVVLRRVVSEQTASQVRSMLARVVSLGTARSISEAVPTIAGKTGTLDEGGGALFAGFAPSDAPRMVALVYLGGRGGDALYGGSVAAPIFARLSAELLPLF